MKHSIFLFSILILSGCSAEGFSSDTDLLLTAVGLIMAAMAICYVLMKRHEKEEAERRTYLLENEREFRYNQMKDERKRKEARDITAAAIATGSMGFSTPILMAGIGSDSSNIKKTFQPERKSEQVTKVQKAETRHTTSSRKPSSRSESIIDDDSVSSISSSFSSGRCSSSNYHSNSSWHHSSSCDSGSSSSCSSDSSSSCSSD